MSVCLPLWSEVRVSVFTHFLSLLLFEGVILPDSLHEVKSSFLRGKDGRHSVVEVCFGHFVVLVRGVDPFVEDVFEVGF